MWDERATGGFEIVGFGKIDNYVLCLSLLYKVAVSTFTIFYENML